MVTAMGKGGQRTPAQIIQGLFAAGQQGFWLPFTDFASLSQDSAGTLPYTALEQPVGRVLDKSRGLELGPEKAIVTGFTSAPVGGPSVSVYAAASLLTVGRTYLLSFTISDFVGSGDAGLDASSAGTQVRVSGNGSYTFRYSALADGAAFFSRDTNSYTCSGITFRELKGNHASQPTSTARGVVSARVNALLNTDNPAAWGYAGSRFSVGAKDVDGGWPLTHILGSSIAVNTDYPIGASGVTDATIVRSIELQAGTASFVTYGAASLADAVQIDLVSKTIVTNVGGLPVSITALPDNWVRLEFWASRAGNFSASSLSNYMTWGIAANTVTVGSTIKVRKPSYSRQALGYTASVPFQRVGATPTDYDSVGFPKCLRLDGTDDFYTCAGGGSTTGFYYSDVVRPTTSTFSALLTDNTASGGYLVQRTNTGIYFAANAGAAITSVSLPLAANVQAFVSAMDDGVNLTLQVNGAEASIARPVVTAGSSTMYLGRYITVAQYFSGTMTEPIYRAGPPPSAYERSVIRAYQMQKAGLL